MPAASSAGSSAAGEAALAARTGLVGEVVVLEDGFLVLGRQFPVGVDGRRVLHQAARVVDLEVARPHSGRVEGHEHQPAPGRQAHRDRGEGGLVAAGVHVHGLECPDLVATVVDHIVAAPFSDIRRLEHLHPPVLVAPLLPQGLRTHPERSHRSRGQAGRPGGPGVTRRARRGLDVHDGAGQGPGDAGHALDLGDHELPEIIHVVRLGPDDHVVGPGDVLGQGHPLDAADTASDLGGLAHLCLNEDVCLDHASSPGASLPMAGMATLP